jgi:large subunit ribosomal protein L30
MSKFLKVQLRYSAIAKELRQKQTLRGLGLRHRHQVRILKDTPAIRGLINAVRHLVSFEETKEAHLPKREKIVTYKLGAVHAPKEPKKEKKKPVEAKEPKAAKLHGEKKAPAKKAPAPKGPHGAKKHSPAKKAHKK